MRLILQFMLPVFLGNLFQQMYNLVDTMIVGRLLGVNALASVGATGSLIFVVLGWVIGTTSGFGVMISQSFGAQDEKRMREQLAAAVVWCVLQSVVMTIVFVLFNDRILHLMNAPDTIFEGTRAYMHVIYCGICASFLYNMLAATSRALGDSKTPLYFLIISSLLNIVLDYTLIAIIPLGVAGAACATVASQAVSGVLCFLYIRRKYPLLRFCRSDWERAPQHLLRLMSIGAPMGLQFSITGIGTMIVQTALNLLGATYIAGFSAAIKVQNTVTQVFPAIGVTVANYTGQNRGAGDLGRVREGVRSGLLLTVICAILCAIFVFFGSDPLTQLFVSGDGADEVIAASRTLLHISLWFYIPLGTIFIFRNVLQGLGYGLVPMMGGIFELAARAVGTVLLASPFGYAGICFTDPLAWVSALIPLIPYYIVKMKKIVLESQGQQK